ncbi:hypothetical protein [Streptomyces diastatochromogenes]|uniref:Uncharacterized protein n=1 Tax=Streptomyces diastatochromogenes TaxID=42236 RepID=A0A233S0P8_STRDA|nr:hypothetical protein [Streptomyces diastatochromogenes]OXY89217.1 hypothetical protein BEK98_39205 [Streptomyces diastatochromogenes]
MSSPSVSRAAVPAGCDAESVIFEAARCSVAFAMAACAVALRIPAEGPSGDTRRAEGATRGVRDEALEGA